MSHMASCDQNKYISIAKTRFLLNASFERITCFIDFRALSSRPLQGDKNREVVTLQVYNDYATYHTFSSGAMENLSSH